MAHPKTLGVCHLPGPISFLRVIASVLYPKIHSFKFIHAAL